MKHNELTVSEHIDLLREAIKPLAAIADAYEQNGLDQYRPEWLEKGVDNEIKWEDAELYTGRGGKTLITLRDAFKARYALTGKAIPDAIKATRDPRCIKLENEHYPAEPKGTTDNTSGEMHVKNCKCV